MAASLSSSWKPWTSTNTWRTPVERVHNEKSHSNVDAFSVTKNHSAKNDDPEPPYIKDKYVDSVIQLIELAESKVAYASQTGLKNPDKLSNRSNQVKDDKI